MMSKTKVIAFAAAFALMIMGVGYSFWSQNIPITVTGRLGTFRVGVADAAAVDQDGAPQDSELAAASRNCDVVVLSAFKLLPNGARYYTVTFKNTGDANAVLDKVVLTPKSGSSDVLGTISIKVDDKQRVNMGATRTVKLNKKLPSGGTMTIAVKMTLADDAPLSEQEQAFEVEIKPYFEQD